MLSLAVVEPVGAQDTLRLTLDQAIELAVGQGKAAKVAWHDSVAAAGGWRAAGRHWLPQLAWRAEGPEWTQSRSSHRTTLINAWHSELTLRQELPWGADIELGNGLWRQQTDYKSPGAPTTNNDWWRYSQSARLSQPLLAGNPVGRQQKLARLDWQSSLLTYDIRLRDIRYRATVAFFSLVSAFESLEISRQDLEQGRGSEELAMRKLKAGFVPEVELLQIQVDVARRESSVREAEGALDAAMDELRVELNAPPGSVLMPLFDAWGDTSLPVAPPPPAPGVRPDVMQKELQLQRSEIGTRESLAQTRLSTFLNIGYNSYSLASQYADALKGADQEDLTAELTVQLPLFGFGTTSGRVQAQRAELRSARVNNALQVQQIEADQREAYRRLERAADRIRIADKALGLSQRSYQITEERFANGLVSSRDLLSVQLDLTRTRTEAVRARIDYQLAFANIRRFAPAAKD